MKTHLNSETVSLMSIPKTVILTAPQGSGKSRDAEAMRIKLGCTKIVEEWGLHHSLTPGALHLTNEHPNMLLACDLNSQADIIVNGWKQ